MTETGVPVLKVSTRGGNMQKPLQGSMWASGQSPGQLPAPSVRVESKLGEVCVGGEVREMETRTPWEVHWEAHVVPCPLRYSSSPGRVLRITHPFEFHTIHEEGNSPQS